MIDSRAEHRPPAVNQSFPGPAGLKTSADSPYSANTDPLTESLQEYLKKGQKQTDTFQDSRALTDSPSILISQSAESSN